MRLFSDRDVPTPFLIATLVCLKATLLALDPTMRLYLGDSAAFLYGAMDEGRLPDDRSFTYSLIVRAFVWPFRRLALLGWWQAAAGVATASMLWVVLTRRFSISRRVAGCAACLFALEPAQLYYERMVLAETFGLLAFVLFFAACTAYLATGRAWWLPIAVALGLAAASLRLNYLPVVLVLSVALPLFALLDPTRATVRRLTVHLAVALIATTTFHVGYRYLIAGIFGAPPGYLARAGFMQLGLVVPLVQPQHLEQLGLPADLEGALQFPLAAPHARMRHMWTPGGLVSEIRRRQLDVESIARPLARMAIVDDPVGLVRLGLHTLGDYFRPAEIQHALHNDLGRRAIPEPILWTLRERWGYDAHDLPTRVTLVSRAFETGTWWLVGCLLLLGPLALANVVIHWRTRVRVQALLVAVVSVGLVIAHVLFVPVALYRYLHPLPFFVLLNAVPIAGQLQRDRRDQVGSSRQL